MMGRFLVFLNFYLLCPAALLQETDHEYNPPTGPVVFDPLARPINSLGVEIHKKLSGQCGNLFFSPASISTALGMLLYGARGRTQQNMRSVLGFQNANLTDSEVHIAYKNHMQTLSHGPLDYHNLYMTNAALIRKDFPILPSYKTGLKNIYQAIAKEVDSENKEAIAREINDWAKERTHNHIKRFIKEEQLEINYPFVLLSTVYFKGTWEKQFKGSFRDVFFNRGLESRKTEVHYMELHEYLPYAHIEDEHLQFVEMPYKGYRISMVILLPDAKDGLTQVERNLTPSTFGDMRRRTCETNVHLSFPKLQLNFKKELKKVLRNLGLGVFGNDADLSGISTESHLKVSKIFHRAFMEVNEKGTAAAAPTSRLIMPKSAMYSKHVKVDHPFLFAIFDVKTDLILFIGRVEKL